MTADLTRSELAPYPSPDERDRTLARLTEAARGEIVTFGQSVQGRPLLAARLPCASEDGTSDPQARVLITGGIHGIEYVSSAVALGVLERLPTLEGLRRLRYRSELWIVPCVNPDGYARTWERDGRGSVAELRGNAHGVDLNRNFPLPPRGRRLPLPGAGSSKPGAATYVGPHPLSEPETASLAALLSEQRFAAGTNGHSFMGRTIPPFAPKAADHATYAALCRAFAAAQPHTRYDRLASRFFNTFTGELEDFQHHVLGTWAICVETFPIRASFRQHLFAPSPFWRFNPREPTSWVDNDVPAIAAFLNAALDRAATTRRR